MFFLGPSSYRLRSDHGAPISRPRVFILFIRQELMLQKAVDNFEKVVCDVMEKMLMEPKVHWNHVNVQLIIGQSNNQHFLFQYNWVATHKAKLRKDLLLSNDHWAVKQDMQGRSDQSHRKYLRVAKTLDRIIWCGFNSWHHRLLSMGCLQ